MALGERIKIVRKYFKYNQRDFSKVLGLSQAHISNIETNKDNPSDKILMKISATFNVSFDWLKSGQGEMTDCSPILQEELSELIKSINTGINDIGSGANCLCFIDGIKSVVNSFEGISSPYKINALSVFFQEISQTLILYKKHYDDSDIYSSNQIDNNLRLESELNDRISIAVNVLFSSLFLK